MRSLALAFAFALALVVPGCLQAPGAGVEVASSSSGHAPLTEPAYTKGSFVSAKVPAQDGTPLQIDIQLPNGSGPFPTLVMYSPYTNNLNAGDEAWGTTAGASSPPGFVNFYVVRGYAVAVAHVRGSGQSGGCFTVGGPDEARDGYSIVEWVASRSWSNHKVAMLGTSYLGTTPISTATLNPPHLTTIVPVSAVTEWYRYYFENGEPRFFGELPFGVVYTDQPLWMSFNVMPKPRNPGAAAETPKKAGCAADIAREAYLQDDYDANWVSRNYVKDVPNATVPMLYAHGFLDENTPTSLVPDFFNAYGGEKRMWLQQHGHGVPASFKEYHEQVHRWLDHYLLGLDNGALEQPAVILQDQRGKYHTLPEWPLANASTLTFYLAEGKLEPAAPAPGKASWTDDARALEEVRAKGVPAGGSFLRFESAPLAEDVAVSGAPRLSIVASSSAKDTQFDALLYDLAPDGKLSFVTRGYLDARHRDSLAKGADLEPGKEYTFAWPMHARDVFLAKDHKLVLTLASSDKYVVPDAPGAKNTITLGPSVIVLPVLPAQVYADKPPVIP